MILPRERRGNSERLFEHPLFDGVDPATRASVAPRLRSESVRRHQFVSRRLAHGGTVCLVLDGLLLEVMEGYSGQRVVLDVAGRGAAVGVGEGPGDGDAAYLAALSTEVVAVALDELLGVAARDPALARNLLALTLRRGQRRTAHILAMSQSAALARVCLELLAFRHYLGLGPEAPVALIPRLTHSDFADIAGIRRETATIQFQRLRRARAVSWCSDGLRIDAGALAAMAEGAEMRAHAGRRPAISLTALGREGW